MRKLPLYMSSEYYEVIEESNGDCFIKDIEQHRSYFKKNFYASQNINFRKIEEIKWNLWDSIFVILILASIFLGIYVALNYSNIYRAESFNTSMYVYSAMYVVMSIVTHELGHAMTMKIYKRKYGKIRLKIYYYLFPAIVTDTTDSYILPRYRRAFVYYAGVMVNLITFGLTLLLVPNSEYLLRIVIWGPVYNLIPFGGMKTDGYHIFINTLMNVKDFKLKHNLISDIAKYIFFIFMGITILDSILRCMGYEGVFAIL